SGGRISDRMLAPEHPASARSCSAVPTGFHGGRSMVRHTLLLALTLIMLSGCGQQAAPPIDKPMAQVEPKPQPLVVQPGEDPKKPDPPAVDPNKMQMPAFFSAD